jgi:hypothetical protein
MIADKLRQLRDDEDYLSNIKKSLQDQLKLVEESLQEIHDEKAIYVKENYPNNTVRPWWSRKWSK